MLRPLDIVVLLKLSLIEGDRPPYLQLANELHLYPSEVYASIKRARASHFVQGPELKDRLEIKDLPEEDRGRYNTLAGMIMLLLGRLPRTTDTVEWGDWRFEVVDLDGKRVDKVLVSRNTSPGEQP